MSGEVNAIRVRVREGSKEDPGGWGGGSVAMLLDPAKASVGAFRRKAPERHCAAALVGEELFFVGQSEKVGVGWGGLGDLRMGEGI